MTATHNTPDKEQDDVPWLEILTEDILTKLPLFWALRFAFERRKECRRNYPTKFKACKLACFEFCTRRFVPSFEGELVILKISSTGNTQMKTSYSGSVQLGS